MLRPQREAGLRDLGVGILDELAFIKHGVAKFNLIEECAMFAELRVARQPNDRVFANDKVVACFEHINGEMRIKPEYFFTPYRHHTSRTYDDMGATDLHPCRNKREHLQGFAQPHLIRQQAVTTHVAQMVHPLHSPPLIRTQYFRQLRRGRSRREHGLTPCFQFGRKRQFETRVAVERKDKIRRNLTGGLGIRDVALPRLDRIEPIGRQ